jgi:hypothetical protein
MEGISMESALKIEEEDWGADRELLMLNDIFAWHGSANAKHIMDICGDEDKFRNLVSTFFDYAGKHSIEFSATYSEGVGQIRLEKKGLFS